MRPRYKKRILAVILVAVFCVTSLSVNIFASSRRGIVEGFSGEDTLEDMWSLGYSDERSHMDIVVKPGDELVIPLTANMFEWEDQRTLLPNQAVNIRELKRNVRVRTHVQAGWEVLDYVQLDTDMVPGKPFYQPNSTAKTGRTACISIAFADELVSVKDVDFRLDIYLTVAGQRDPNYKISLHGTMVHDVVDILPSSDTYVDISDGVVAHADDFGVLNNLTNFNLGNGVKVSKLTWAGRKYYGTTSWKPSTVLSPEDYPVIYNSIHGVYVLSTVNIEEGVNRVTLNPPKDKDDAEGKKVYFVYAEDMTYLGTTAEVLPYSDTYILTTKELDAFETGTYIDNLEDAPNQTVAEKGELADISINDFEDITPVKEPFVVLETGEILDH